MSYSKTIVVLIASAIAAPGGLALKANADFDKVGGPIAQVKQSPSLDERIGERATSFDLAVVGVRLSDVAEARPKFESRQIGAIVTVQNLAGLTPCFLVATTGDSTTSDRLNKTGLMRLGRGQSAEIPLPLYTNPAHVNDGVFRASVWLGTSTSPLVYADTNRGNNVREIHFGVEPLPVTAKLRPSARPGGRIPLDHTAGSERPGEDEEAGSSNIACDEMESRSSKGK